MILEHWHKELEINYVCEGPTGHIVGGACHRCSAGDVYLINSGRIHSVVKHFTVLDNACDAFTIIIDDEFLKLLIPDFDTYTFAVTEEALPAIRTQMQALLECYQQESRHRNIALTGMVYVLVSLLCDRCRKEKGIIELKAQRHIRHICEIMEYVAAHYQDTTSQAEAARQMGFSREHFCRYFKQYTGITFREYLTRYRLDKVKHLLERTTDTELKIALDVGFSDVKQMSTSFKKHYGVTPSQYRRTVRNNI